MKQAKLRAATLGGSADETEAAFYQALQKGDLEGLMACWADEEDIVCVQPGAPRLLGAAAIRAAFATRLRAGGLPVEPSEVQRVQALASSVHSVIERMPPAGDGAARERVVQATNVYHKTAQGWRLVAHHASAATLQPAAARSPGAATVLH